MSVASLNNGSLQLAELVVSNEKYSNASGYAAASSSFVAGLTGTSLSVDGPVSANSFTTTIGGTSTFDNITAIGNVTSGGIVSADSFSTTNAGTSTFDNITTIGNVTSGGIVSADSFSTTTAGTSTFNIVSITGALTCQGIVASGTLSVPTLNVSNNIGFIGASGNGSLTISADGSILYFNGVQIN